MPRWPARLADQVRAHTVFSLCNLRDHKLLIFALEQILGFSLSWFQDSRISQTPNGTQSQSKKRIGIDEIEKQTKSWKADWPFSCWLDTQTNTKVLNLNRTLFKTKHQTNQWKRYDLFCPQYLVYKAWSMQCIHASCFKIQSSSSRVPTNTQTNNKFKYGE